MISTEETEMCSTQHRQSSNEADGCVHYGQSAEFKTTTVKAVLAGSEPDFIQ